MSQLVRDLSASCASMKTFWKFSSARRWIWGILGRNWGTETPKPTTSTNSNSYRRGFQTSYPSTSFHVQFSFPYHLMSNILSCLISSDLNSYLMFHNMLQWASQSFQILGLAQHIVRSTHMCPAIGHQPTAPVWEMKLFHQIRSHWAMKNSILKSPEVR